jgi:drug/metabolite transporter (DMT)-like permease
MIETIKKWMDESVVDEIVIFAVVLAIVESIAQNTIKLNSNGYSKKFIIGIVFYMGVGYILHLAYMRYSLSKINTMWSCLSILFAITMGYLLYGEPLNRWTILAAIFALAAIYCLDQA